MNREETKKAIEVMQAYVDGETVQVLTKELGWSDRHVDNVDPNWDFRNYEYRVKPKPLECWVAVLDGAGSALTYIPPKRML